MDTNFDVLAEDCLEYSQDRYNQLEELMDDFINNGISILALGLGHHGKSTLLNALMKDCSYQDLDSTTKFTHYQIDSEHYLDSPGFEHIGKHTNLALSLIANTDLHLFVHSLSKGLLSSVELEFLQLICSHMDKEAFFDRTILVLTHSHHDGNSLDSTALAKIKDQLQQEFGYELNFNILSVDAKDYDQGLRTNNPKLLDEAGINELKKQISHIKAKLMPKLNQFKLKNIKAASSEIKQELLANRQRMDKLIAKKAQACEQLEQEFDRYLSDFKQLEEALFSSQSEYIDEGLLQRLHADMQACHHNNEPMLNCYTKEQGCELLEQLKECILEKYDLDPSFEERCPKLQEMKQAHRHLEQNIKLFDHILLKIEAIDSQLAAYKID